MKTYVNLTSGLEAIKIFDLKDYGLVRIQSSHLEANALWKLIAHLDYAFLIDAATQGVMLWDGGSRNGPISRAQWKGIPWIKYLYQKSNGLLLDQAIVKSYNATPEFDQRFCQHGPDRDIAVNKMRYVYKLTGAEHLVIEPKGFVSTMDGKALELAELAGLRV